MLSVILTILFLIISAVPFPLLIVEIILFAKAKGDDAKRKKLKIAIIITSIILGIVLIALISLAVLMMSAIMYM